jgi:hypothetical protein
LGFRNRGLRLEPAQCVFLEAGTHAGSSVARCSCRALPNTEAHASDRVPELPTYRRLILSPAPSSHPPALVQAHEFPSPARIEAQAKDARPIRQGARVQRAGVRACHGLPTLSHEADGLAPADGSSHRSESGVRAEPRGEGCSTVELLAAGASALQHDRVDLLGRVGWPLVLPNADHGPTKGFERDIGLLISAAVGPNLLSPPSRVRFGRHAVIGAPMPEASVDEHNDAGTREHDVDSPSREPRYWPIDTKTQTSLVQQ